MTTQLPILSPEPAQMHLLIDRWAGLFAALVKIIETERLEHDAEVRKLQLELSQVATKLEVQAAPLEKQIQAHESEIRLLQSQVRDGQQTLKNATERLALIVDMNPNSRGVTLDSIITQVVLFVDESKRQFRETL